MEALKKQIHSMNRKVRKGLIDTNDWWRYLESGRLQHGEKFNDNLKEVLRMKDDAVARLRSYKSSPLFRFRIRQFCNEFLHSDIEPNEVVEVISQRKVVIRQMDAVQKEFPKDFHIGGFAANCSDNAAQRWECVSNPENPTKVITLTKNGWGGGRFKMSDSPKKFYDYNF